MNKNIKETTKSLLFNRLQKKNEKYYVWLFIILCGLTDFSTNHRAIFKWILLVNLEIYWGWDYLLYSNTKTTTIILKSKNI